MKARSPRVLLASSLITSAAVLVPSLAHADDADGYGPYMKSLGNLRVDAMCAEGMLTPQRGMRVYIDGVPAEPKQIDTIDTVSYDENGSPVYGSMPIDVSFLAPIGQHLVRIESPDCLAMEREMNFSGTLPSRANVNMPVSTESLRGTVGAPDGFTFAMSVYASGLPGAISQGSNFKLDTPRAYGGFFTFGYEHRNLALTFDNYYGGSSFSGTGQSSQTGVDGQTATVATKISGWGFEQAWAFRIGGRIPLRSVALASGLGVGLSLWLFDRKGTGDTPGSSAHVSWYVPLWATATYKPSCDYGLQLGGMYRYDPTYTKDSTFFFTLGLELQPNDACSRKVGFDVIEP